MLMSVLELNALLALAGSWPASGRLVRYFDHLLGFRVGVLARELVRDLIQEVRRVAELEQKLHSGEVHTARLGEIADRAHALQILVRVQADIGVRPDRIEQTFLLVNTESAWMAARQPRRDADDVHGSPCACHGDI